VSTSADQMQQDLQAATVRVPKRLPLVTPFATRNNVILKDSRLVNCYGEKLEGNDWAVNKRPCLQGILQQAGVEEVIGFFAYGRWAFLVGQTGVGTANLYIYDLSTGTPVLSSTSAVNGLDDFYSFYVAPTGLTDITVVMQNGVAGYVLPYTTVPPVLAPITDVNYPANTVPGWAALDGTTYVMGTNGEIFGSAVDDPTTWPALEAIAADSDPDAAIALAQHLTYVVALKQWTTNFFYDAGNPAPGSPLSPVPDSQVPYGCWAATTVQEIDGNLIWMTSGKKNVQPQIGRLNNLSFAIVSDPSIDRLLQVSGQGDGDFRSWTLKSNGHRWYGLTNLVQNWTIVYDLDSGRWQVWTDYLGNCFPVSFMASQTETAYPSYNLAMGVENATMWSVQPDYVVPVDSWWNGAGFSISPPAVDIYTPSYDGGTRRKKTLNFMFFNGDKVAGSILKSRWNDDDYQTTKWSNFRQIDLAAVTPQLPNNGTFRRRAYHFRHQCPTAFRLKTVDLQLDIGTL